MHRKSINILEAVAPDTYTVSSGHLPDLQLQFRLCLHLLSSATIFRLTDYCVRVWKEIKL